MAHGYGPPFPPQQPPPPPPPGGLPVWAQLLIGVLAGPPLLLGAGWFPTAFLSLVAGGNSAVDPLLALVGLGVPLALLVAACVWRPSRWYAVGAIIGTALLLVVLAGACIVLLSNLN